MGHILFVAFVGLLAGAFLFAWWRGGGPERVVATMFVAAWLATTATKLPAEINRLTVAYHTLAIDTLLLIGLLAVARRANRIWPVAAASLSLLIVLAHLARMINTHQFRFVYIVMTEFWPYLQLLLLIAGTALHWRRAATRGAEPSWRS